MTFDLQKAREICEKINGREIFNAGCCTVAEMVKIDGREEPEFCEVAHPEYCDWCEILPFTVNSLHAAIARIEELEKALIEERATGIIEGQPFCLVASTDQDVLGEEDSCEHEGNCELKSCPNIDWYTKKAREQLQKEGLI